MSNLVCRACYRPAPDGLKPGEAFVCKCYKPQKGSRVAARWERSGQR